MKDEGTGTRANRPLLVASRDIYRGRVLALRIDTLDLGGGNEAHREVVEHADGATILPLDGQGRILLVRQHRQPPERDLLELPAGSLEGHESPEACAERELREETGMRPGRLERLGGFYLAPGYATEYQHVFLATDLRNDPLDSDDDEDIEVRAVTPDELHAMVERGEIEDAKTLAALLLYERRR